MEIYTIITTFLIISYKITITCLICDGNTHILNFQTILHVVTVPVISSICSENILNLKYEYFQTILHVVTVPVISSICSENILNLKYEYFHHKSNKL